MFFALCIWMKQKAFLGDETTLSYPLIDVTNLCKSFEDKDKIAICILSTIILTGAVVTTGSLISKCGHSNDIKEIREQVKRIIKKKKI